ncbi:MAG: GNAT family N-acetyltransferase [Niastella sp.]|mgnify:CR=1 FL=1|nr:GNAT family N-acetyltransferase [Niastella sp.]
MIIKKAGIADIEIIRSLVFKIWPSAYSAILSEAQIRYMLDLLYNADELKQQFQSHTYQYVIGYQKNIPIAFAAYHIFNDDGLKCKLDKIYILPQQQKTGFGKQLLLYVLKEAKQENTISLTLNVNRYNKALDFYVKMGFKIIKEEDIDIGNGYFMNDYVMEMKIS